MFLVSVCSLLSVSFAMEISRRTVDSAPQNVLELGPQLGPVFVPEELVQEEDGEDERLQKRGVDPMSIPRLVKEPPLKRSELSNKRGDAVYPSASKHTVPLIRVREPPLKRDSLSLMELAEEVASDDDVEKYLRKLRFSNPPMRLRFQMLRDPEANW